MKTIKRTVAALLATLMLATSTSFTLAAETYTDDEAVVVAKVNAAGIMTGTDKGFEPSKSLTRAEAAAIIVRMKGISESAVKAMAGTTLFNDVAASHWASGYVNEASNLGIVKGVSATEFAPDREVTVAEFVTMAIRALGAGQLVDSEGTWPTNYVNFANENGILDDVAAIYTATATRMNAATIVANTLETSMWEKTSVKSNGEIGWTNTNGKTILANTLNIVKYSNQMPHTFDLSERTISLCIGLDDEEDPIYKGLDVASKVDMTTLKAGIKYDYWYDTKAKEIVGFWEAEDAEEESVSFDEIVKSSADTITLSVNGSDKKYDLADSVQVYYNNVKTEATSAFKAGQETGTYSKAKVEVAKAGNEYVFGTAVIEDDEIVALYLQQYTNIGVVEEVTSTRVKFNSDITVAGYTKTSSALKLDDEDVTYSVTKSGKEIEISDLEEGDVVLFYIDDESATNDIYNMIVLDEKVEGEVTAIGSDYIKVDGKKYEFIKSLELPEKEDEIIAYFNDANKLVAYEDVKSTGKYAVVKSVEVVNGRKGLEVEVVLAYADGTESEKMTLDLKDDKNMFDGIVGKNTTGQDAKTYVVDDQAETAAEISEINGLVLTGKSILKSLVNYEIKDNKIIIKAFDEDEEPVKFESAKVYVGTKTYFTNDTDKYYVTSSTKIIEIKDYTKDKDKYKVKVEIVDVDSLTTNTTTATYYLADIDDNNNVGLVVCGSIKKDVKSDNWYYVIDKASIKGDDKYEITAISSENEEVTFVTDLDDSDCDVKDFGLLTLDGNKVTLVDPDTYAEGLETNNTYYFFGTEEGVIKVGHTYSGVTDETYGTMTTEELVLSDNVIFIAEKDGKYTIGKESAIEEVTTFTKDDVLYVEEDYVDCSTISSIITFTDEDGVKEVVGVVYVK